MHARKSAAKSATNSAGTLKKISFKKDASKLINDQRYIFKANTEAAGLNPCETNLQERDNGEQEGAQPIPSTSGIKQQLKVKRKSLNTPFRSNKKRVSSVECTVNLPSTKSDHVVKFNCENPPYNSSDSLSDFWGDDHLFADFNLSDAVHSSLESTSYKYSLASTPKVKKGCTTIPKSEPIDEETFYGLPLDVKKMFSQYRGIEELYGKIHFFFAFWPCLLV